MGKARGEGDRTLGRVVLYAAFARAAVRYWLFVFPRVAAELRRWRRTAIELDHPSQRALALDALSKRSNIEGAAAFAAFAPRRQRKTGVRALVAFQSIYNYTDLLAEQPSPDPVASARRLHEALLAALDAYAGPLPADATDTGVHAEDRYLAELVATCRDALAELPSYALVAPFARRASERIVAFQSLSLGCAGELERWAEGERSETGSLTAGGEPMAAFAWWEIAAAAGSSLAVHALIAAAASPTLSERDAARIDAAYSCAICALHSLLDSLVDRAEDAATGQLSLIDCYASPREAADRLAQLTREALDAAAGLLDPSAHVMLVTAMTSSYLELAATSTDLDAFTRRTGSALGPAATPVMVVFKLRRLASRVRSSLLPGAPTRGEARAPVREPPKTSPTDPEPQGADA